MNATIGDWVVVEERSDDGTYVWSGVVVGTYAGTLNVIRHNATRPTIDVICTWQVSKIYREVRP